MGILYIAGERPGAGATSVAVALATLWRRAGNRVTVVKAAVSRDNDPDPAFFMRNFQGPAEEPLVADQSEEMIQAIANQVILLNDNSDVVIVEGLPFTDNFGARDSSSQVLAERLGARVLGVIPYHRTVDSSSAVAWRETYASSLAGVIVNRRTIYGEHDSATRLAPAFEEAGVRIFGTLTEERLLLAPTIQQVSDLLGGTFYAGASGNQELVEHFLIGGLITEWGGNYFGRLSNQAVLVRGGRTDIQMAALNSPLNGLFLTGCQKPPQYVHQRATDLDVPLVVVEHDTPTTTALLDTMESAVSIDHPVKIDLVAEMVRGAVDVAAVGSTVGLRGG
ncbi:MAG: DRTGG domain-containing protein [Chloroflexi bacterium]|nr:DRTGG domain-containing protein [Chloroflexota bacterium]